MPVTLTHPDGRVEIEELPKLRRRVSVRLADPSVFMPFGSCETSYPASLIEAILQVKGPAWVCDEILRDESPLYVESELRFSILGFVSEQDLAGKRLLDFGCGCGSSTMVVSRLLPDTAIVGVELQEESLAVARARARHYELEVPFLRSPSGSALPEGIGGIDAILLSAVYEHLLPLERNALMGMLWRILRPGGVLFVNQLPHRYFPVETHTTGLPLLNYLPDAVALAVARRSSRLSDEDTWELLLRGGIRGGTQREIVQRLARIGDGVPRALAPERMGLRDHADLWYAVASRRRWSGVKRLLRLGYRAMSVLTADPFAPTLSIAIRKG